MLRTAPEIIIDIRIFLGVSLLPARMCDMIFILDQVVLCHVVLLGLSGHAVILYNPPLKAHLTVLLGLLANLKPHKQAVLLSPSGKKYHLAVLV